MTAICNDCLSCRNLDDNNDHKIHLFVFTDK